MPKHSCIRTSTERHTYTSDEVEELIRDALHARHFLDGRPGTAQTVTIDYDFSGQVPEVVFEITTQEISNG